MYRSIIRPFLFRIDPERVHDMLFRWLKFYHYLTPLRACVRRYYKRSSSFTYHNLKLKNRIGLSAGFDKNAEVFDELADFGFGFLEVGTVTPDYQAGNPAPRIFRVVNDDSLISRTGFNNPGVTVVLDRIKKHRKHSYVLGVNINKKPESDGKQAVEDFKLLFCQLYAYVDYFTLNWGSVDAGTFAEVLELLTSLREQENDKRSIFIKLPADIKTETLDEVIALAHKYSIDGFVATGPTMDRSGLKRTDADELERMGAGGVSGRGIGKKSLEVVRYLHSHTQHSFLIIGAGGIMTDEDANEMFKAGAELIQIYSAFIYSGPSVLCEIGE